MEKELNEMYELLMTGLVELLPRLIMAVVVALLGYLIARIVERLVRKTILYLDNVLNNQLRQSLLNVDLEGSARFISKTIFWIILFITVMSCIHILQLDFLTQWFGAVLAYVPNVLAAVIIIFVGIIVGRLAGDLISSATTRTGLANGKYIGRLVRYLIIFIAIIIVINQLGVDITFLTSLITIIVSALLFGAALAFGLGARTSISNILGAYYARKTFSLGDKIEMGDIKGVIVKIDDHAVVLETKTGLMMIPAKDFSEKQVNLIKKQNT